MNSVIKNRVFISHAGEDYEQAAIVAGTLAEKDLIPIFDRNDLKPGDSFISFMDKGIEACDYFFLLWTKLAHQKKWVQLEWESALSREMDENRTFLVVGRLEEYPPPTLLKSRLLVDLFPKFEAGILEFVELIRRDQDAQNVSGRKVLPAKADLQEYNTNDTIYVTSDLFGVTIPVRANLEVPSGVKLTQLVDELGLPHQIAYKDRLGFRLNYRFLTMGETVIEMRYSLAHYGISNGDVLWLEVKMVPFYQTEPVEGDLRSAIFRGQGDDMQMKAKIFATQELNSAISRAGLTSPK